MTRHPPGHHEALDVTRPPPAHTPHLRRRRRQTTEDSRPLHTRFEVTLVDGERGRQLALVQARAIREVLTWWATHHPRTTTSRLDDPA
ncbi:MAG: hypothetical protein LC700_03160 [Actinobacteria bacterium]|nr:hypothetical protein [Actinomycetota bacterium]